MHDALFEHQRQQALFDEAPCFVKAVVEIDCCNQCFDGIGKHRVVALCKSVGCAIAHQEKLVEIELAGTQSKRTFVDQPRPHLRQLTLGNIFVMVKKVLSDDHTQDRIAEKFQSLVRLHRRIVLDLEV